MPVFTGKIVLSTGNNKRHRYRALGTINYSVAFSFRSITGLNLGELYEGKLALERFAWEEGQC